MGIPPGMLTLYPSLGTWVPSPRGLEWDGTSQHKANPPPKKDETLPSPHPIIGARGLSHAL